MPLQTIPAVQFAQWLKQKYPQYSSAPDDKLILAFIKKNPAFHANYENETLVSVSWEVASPVPPQNLVTKKCLSCESPIPVTTKFCSECGASQSEQPERTVASTPTTECISSEATVSTCTTVASTSDAAQITEAQSEACGTSIPEELCRNHDSNEVTQAPAQCLSVVQATSVGDGRDLSTASTGFEQLVGASSSKAETEANPATCSTCGSSVLNGTSPCEVCTSRSAAVHYDSTFLTNRRVLASLALLAVASVSVFAASRSLIVKRWTKLPAMVTAIASDVKEYGSVSISSEPENPIQAIRSNVDLLNSQKWTHQLSETGRCQLQYASSSENSRLTSSAETLDVRVAQTCAINLSGLNPAAIDAVQKAYDGDMAAKTKGFPYWQVELPFSSGGASCQQTRATRNMAEALKQGKDGNNAWKQEASSQVTLTELPLLFKDESAASRVAQMLRDAAYICGATDNREQLRVRAENEAKKKSRDDANRIQTLIANNKEFSVCRVRELEFGRDASVDAGHCTLPDPYCENDTEYRFKPALVLLSKVGYIGGPGHAINTHWGDSYSQVPTEYWWTPNEKGLAAIGGNIQQERVGYYRNGMVAYKWNLVLGCRRLQQIDATTPLADGVKVDFSWQWKPTELGNIDGLSDARQRGEAYLKRTPSGLAVDQINFTER